MRYQNRHVDTYVMSGKKGDIRFVITWKFILVNNHNLGYNGIHDPLT